MTTRSVHRAFPPIRFRAKPYQELCRSFDKALAELVERYPSHSRMLTIEGRARKLGRRPK